MDSQPQSTKCPFGPRPTDLAPVSTFPSQAQSRRRGRRKRRKGRKFGKELQNRGDLVYVRKAADVKDPSTAETEKSAEPRGEMVVCGDKDAIGRFRGRKKGKARKWAEEEAKMGNGEGKWEKEAKGDEKGEKMCQEEIANKGQGKKKQLKDAPKAEVKWEKKDDQLGQKNTQTNNQKCNNLQTQKPLKTTTNNSPQKINSNSEKITSKLPPKPSNQLIHRRNPQNVEKYNKRITNYLITRDRSRRVPSNYLESHKTITAKMRAQLVDWLVDVSLRFKVLDETLFAGVWILDRYLSRTMELEKRILQLAGITSLMLAAKMEEVYPPSAADYLEVCDGAYSEADLLDQEALILSSLRFDLAVATSLQLFRLFTREMNLSRKSYFFGEYLLHCALLDSKSLRYSPNELSAGALFLVDKMFKGGLNWKSEIGGTMGIELARAKVVAKEVYKMLKRSREWAAVKRKYARVEVLEVSKFKVERVSKAGKR